MILYILETTILILHWKLYIVIVSSIVFNIETRQYNIKINLAISCSPNSINLTLILKILYKSYEFNCRQITSIFETIIFYV